MHRYPLAGLFLAAVVSARCDTSIQTKPVLLVLPGPDGVVDIAGAERREDSGELPNPFRRRYRAPPKLQDIPVRIEALVLGAGPETAAVVINGNHYERNDEFEGLEIASIGPDEVELRRGQALARLPVQDAPLVLRLSR